MTVIAFKDDILACDSQWTENEIVSTQKSKIRFLSNGLLYGASGDNDDRTIREFLERMPPEKVLSGHVDEDDFPSYQELYEVKQSFSAIIIIPKSKKIFVMVTATNPDDDTQDLGVVEVTHPFWAIGHGRDLAIGAMETGASAKQAVSTACKFDPWCSEPIFTLTI